MFVSCGLMQTTQENRCFTDNTVALVICEMAMVQLEISGFLDGMGMSRAFRAGVEKNRRIKAPTRQRRWQPLRDLAELRMRNGWSNVLMKTACINLRIDWSFTRKKERERLVQQSISLLRCMLQNAWLNRNKKSFLFGQCKAQNKFRMA